MLEVINCIANKTKIVHLLVLIVIVHFGGRSISAGNSSPYEIVYKNFIQSFDYLN